MIKTTWALLDQMRPKVYVALDDVVVMLRNTGIKSNDGLNLAEHLKDKIKALPIYIEQKPKTSPPTYGGD